MFTSVLKYIVLTIVIAFSVFNVYSAEGDKDISSSNITSDSVELSWTWVEDIFYYKINYWIWSWDLKDEYTDLIDWTTYKFEWLLENTTYYFSVLWYDELWNEGFLSNELSINTLSEEVENMESFYLEDATMVWKDEVELLFSSPLDITEWTEREFNVENVNNVNDYYEVVSSEVVENDEKRLVIKLDWEPSIWEEYKVVVLAIKDKFNQNIENWVDLDATFIWVEINEVEEWFNSANDSEVDETVTEINNDVSVESNEDVVVEENSWVTGVELSAADVENNVLNVADDTSKLPKTGPEQLLIFILAFILSALIFVFKFKKA